MKKEVEKVDELEMSKRLHRRYSAPAWAFLTRVRRGTGFSTVIRTADAIAMSLYPSRGLEIHGFEIKVSTNDWKKELAEPEKAEEMQQFCHRWWIVIPKKEIINLSEVPKNWGVIIAKKNGCSILKDAPFLKAKRIDYPFLAAIFRNQEENYIHKDEFHNKIEERKIGWEKHSVYELREAKKKLKKLEEFEGEVGIKIDSWDNNHKKIGKLSKQLIDMKGDIGWKFKNLHGYAQDIVKAFEGIEEETKGILSKPKKGGE